MMMITCQASWLSDGAGYSEGEPKLAGIIWAPIRMDWQCGAGAYVTSSDPPRSGGTQDTPEHETATSAEAGVCRRKGRGGEAGAGRGWCRD